MRIVLAAVLSFLLCVATTAKDRPRIFGIAYVRISVTDVDKARQFYSQAFSAVWRPAAGKEPCNWCEINLSFGSESKHFRTVELEPSNDPNLKNRLLDVGLQTDDAAKLRSFLKSNRVVVEKMAKCGDDPCFGVKDPEGHHLTFVQYTEGAGGAMPASSRAGIRTPIIHAGFVVRDRAAAGHFYKDILGFRPYWHGGMKDEETDWESLQVPDGTDWIEFMVNVSPDADKRTRGVMNHIALGVPDIQVAAKQLLSNGMKLNEEPKMGRDGKWQLNLYDPDQTRVELMEFRPVEKPCCSDYTGPHPKP